MGSLDAKLASKAREETGRSIVALLLEEPFYGHLLAGIVRNFAAKTQTAAVAMTRSGLQLWINPEFFVKTLRRKDERTAVIKHEALHLLYKHLTRFDPMKKDMLLYNIAADLVVNQFVAPWPLPEGAVTLATFPDMNLPADQTVAWYYDKLETLRNEILEICQHSNLAGMNRQGQSETDYSKTSAPESAEALDRLVGTSWHSDHSAWANSTGGGEGEESFGGAVPDTIRDAIENELERHIIQTKARAGAKAWGNLPGPLRAEIDAMIERRKPKVSWKRVLRLFTNSSRRTRVVATATRKSKRYGTFPGIKIKRLQHLAVAIDTSGSVSDDCLSMFFAEIHAIWRQGASIDVIECDAEVQRVYPYKGKLPTAVAGRGGTAFDPVFRYLRKQRMTRYDGVIYLTDGHAQKPELRPPCKVLWLITPGGTKDRTNFGRAIELPASPR